MGLFSADAGGLHHFLPGKEGQAILLYPTTEGQGQVTANVKVVYDIQEQGDATKLRVRVSVQIMNGLSSSRYGEPS